MHLRLNSPLVSTLKLDFTRPRNKTRASCASDRHLYYVISNTWTIISHRGKSKTLTRCSEQSVSNPTDEAGDSQQSRFKLTVGLVAPFRVSVMTPDLPTDRKKFFHLIPLYITSSRNSGPILFNNNGQSTWHFILVRTVIKPNTVNFFPQSSFSKKKGLITLGNPIFLQHTVNFLHPLFQLNASHYCNCSFCSNEVCIDL